MLTSEAPFLADARTRVLSTLLIRVQLSPDIWFAYGPSPIVDFDFTCTRPPHKKLRVRFGVFLSWGKSAHLVVHISEIIK